MMRPLAALATTLLVVSSATIAQEPAANGNATALLLAALIRINTSNPPGNEGSVAEFLAPRFRALGFDVDIIPTPQAGKAHFIARLRGNGSRKPLLLAAHADVVGVEREKWSVDPFAGVIENGQVTGRGAVDFKGGMAVFARAAMLLAERKVPLARDVIFMAEADEEGGRYGTSWLAQSNWPKMDAEFVLNEGGWIIKDANGRVQYVSISTADKSAVSLVVSAKGTSTHASMPLPDNAIFALSKALAKLADLHTPVELTPDTRQFFLTLASTTAGELSRQFRNLVHGTPAQVIVADSIISRDPLLHAIMRNTIAPVIINGGFRSNVIPGSAEATINLRLIPGTPVDSVIRAFERVINDPRIEVRRSTAAMTATPGGSVATNSAPTAPIAATPRNTSPSSKDTDLYRALVIEANVQWPGVAVTPYLFQAGTDAAAWRSRGVPVYGIYPYPITANELTRMHGNDETVSMASLEQGTNLVYRTLVRVAGRDVPKPSNKR